MILDEIQNAPELFNWVRTRIDESPSRKGRWFLTGSQDSALMQGVSESMAGRAAILHLLPLSTRESPRVSPLVGGYPEVALRPKSSTQIRQLWFSSYVQTYLERDVRSLAAIKDLSAFRRFMALVATRTGQVLNRTELAAPLGVSVPTISAWLSILEATSIIALVPPYFESLGKRIVKSPRLHMLDAGLACHLLGVESETALRKSPFFGPIYESFVVSEILKHQVNAGRRREVYWFRDQTGLEIDLLVPTARSGNRRERDLALVEVKAGSTVEPSMARGLHRVAASLGDSRAELSVVYGALTRPTSSSARTTAIAPGVRAVTLAELLDALHP